MAQHPSKAAVAHSVNAKENRHTLFLPKVLAAIAVPSPEVAANHGVTKIFASESRSSTASRSV